MSQRFQHAGIYLRLPEELAGRFPPLETDASPRHLTLLYVGEADAEELDALTEACREVASALPPFEVEVFAYRERQNQRGQTIAHMEARSVGEPSLDTVHQAFLAAARARDLEVKHHPGPFLAHITLAYLHPESEYAGAKPRGRFRVDAVEVWTDGDCSRPQIPLAEPDPSR